MGIQLEKIRIVGPLQFAYSGDLRENPTLELYKHGSQIGRIFGIDCYQMVKTILDNASPEHRKTIKEYLERIDV